MVSVVGLWSRYDKYGSFYYVLCGTCGGYVSGKDREGKKERVVLGHMSLGRHVKTTGVMIYIYILLLTFVESVSVLPIRGNTESRSELLVL